MTALITASPAVAPAETWLAQTQRAVEQTAPGTEAHLQAMIEATFAAYNVDCEQALEMANASIEFADTLNDRNALATGLMQRSRIRHQLTSISAAEADYNQAISLFDGDCHPRLQVYFWMTRAAHQRHRAPTGDVVYYLKKGISAAEEANDHGMRSLAEITLLMMQAAPGNLDRETVDRLRAQVGQPIHPAVRTGFELLELHLAAKESSPRELVSLIEAALPRIAEAGIRTADIIALNLLADAHKSLEEFDRALEVNASALDQAQQLKSYQTITEQLLLRGNLAERAGDDELARSSFRDGLAMAMHTDNPTLRNSLYKKTIDEHIKNEDWDGLRDVVSSALGQMDSLLDQREAALQREIDGLNASRTAQKRALQDTAEQLQKQRSSANKHLARWRRYARNIGFAALVAFAAFFFFGGIRLRRVNRELVEQIDEVRRGREMREALEQKVSQIERMDSLGMLAGGVAHDFNNLLIGVLCNAEVLKTRPQENLADDCIDGIIGSARAAADLSQKMLAYAGNRTSEKFAFDLNELIGELLPLLKSGLGTADQIQFTPSDEPAVAEIDPSQIEQVLLNLVTNASDASGEDGEIRIRVGEIVIEDAASDPSMFGQRTTGGEFVFFEVADNGKGISPAALRRMFEPFFTTKSGGRGLGLSVVYGHINKHDGLIRCTSTEGKGTVMRILLPKCWETVKDGDSDKFFTEDSKSGEFTLQNIPSAPIAVVDDDRAVLDVIQRLLARQDYPSEMLLGGNDAIEYLTHHADHVSCIVLDLVMPDVDGDAVLEWMQSNAADVPVVVMTGYSRKKLDEYVKHPNVVGILEKPFSRRELLTEIKRACERGRTSQLEMS